MLMSPKRSKICYDSARGVLRVGQKLLVDEARQRLASKALSTSRSTTSSHKLSYTKNATSTRRLSTKNNSNDDTNTPSHNHCVDLVQSRDREGYLCTLLLPRPARQSAFAIRAFNAEIASIKDSGRAVDGGGSGGAGLSTRMRMAWWRDALDGIYSGKGRWAVVNHPVVAELERAVEEKNLTRRFLERMLTAREYDLNVTQFNYVEDMIRYGDETSGSLLYLMLECVDVVDDSVADRAAYHVGVAVSVVTALRSAAQRAARGDVFVPAELMMRYEVSSSVLFEPPKAPEEMTEEYLISKKGLRHAVEFMAGNARAHLMAASELQYQVKKQAKPCFLPAVGPTMFLDALEKVDYDIFHPSLSDAGRGLGLTLNLGRAWLTGVF